jgi:hypothetical protein
MTVEAHSFPVGYFYIVSKMNGFALDFDPSQEAAVGFLFFLINIYIWLYKKNM